MSDAIKQAFDAYHIELTPSAIDNMIHIVACFEIKQKHSIALNSQMIGVVPIVFGDADRDALYYNFGVDRLKFATTVQKIHTIDQNHKVVSNPFNLLSVWLLHLALSQITDKPRQHLFMMSVAKYLHYRYFTSLLSHYYGYKASEKYMSAAINSLSRKYDIITHGTWKATIEARCQDLIATSSIHYDTLVNANDDKLFLYIIMDTQGRIRDKIKLITKAYYDMRESQTAIHSHSSVIEVDSDDGGSNKILLHNSDALDVMVYNLSNEIMSSRVFIDRTIVKQILTQFTALNEDILIGALSAMVDIAKTQSENKELDTVKHSEGVELYVGQRVFLKMFIEKTYGYCKRNGVDITNKAEVYLRAKNIYSSSRMNDKDITAIKQSIVYLVDIIGSSKRETTKSSLRIALLCYILLKSFRYL